MDSPGSELTCIYGLFVLSEVKESVERAYIRKVVSVRIEICKVIGDTWGAPPSQGIFGNKCNIRRGLTVSVAAKCWIPFGLQLNVARIRGYGAFSAPVMEHRPGNAFIPWQLRLSVGR